MGLGVANSYLRDYCLTNSVFHICMFIQQGDWEVLKWSKSQEGGDDYTSEDM